MNVGDVIGDLACISPSEEWDDRWLIETRENPARYVHLPKDLVTIPPSESVDVLFLENVEFD